MPNRAERDDLRRMVAELAGALAEVPCGCDDAYGYNPCTRCAALTPRVREIAAEVEKEKHGATLPTGPA